MLMIKTAPTAVEMSDTQLSARQPKLWTMKPPISGPRTGPLSGPNEKTDMARGRYWGCVISTMEPPTLDSMTLPATALLMVSNVSVFIGCKENPPQETRGYDGVKVWRQSRNRNQ